MVTSARRIGFNRMIGQRHAEAAHPERFEHQARIRKNSDYVRQDIVLLEPHSPETLRKAGIAVCDRAESREEAEMFLKMLGIIE